MIEFQMGPLRDRLLEGARTAFVRTFDRSNANLPSDSANASSGGGSQHSHGAGRLVDQWTHAPSFRSLSTRSGAPFTARVCFPSPSRPRNSTVPPGPTWNLNSWKSEKGKVGAPFTPRIWEPMAASSG